jgi:hypothetical protein
VVVSDPREVFDCDPASPEVCIPSPSPELDGGDSGPLRLTILPPDCPAVACE